MIDLKAFMTNKKKQYLVKGICMKRSIGLLIILLFSAILMGKNLNQRSMRLNISYSEQEDNLTVTLVNKTRKPVKVFEKNELGQFDNLRFIIVSDDNDSMFVDFDESFEEYGHKPNKEPKLKKLKRGKTSQCVIEQFTQRYTDVFQPGHEYTIQAVYQTLYVTPLKGKESIRSEMIERDVVSNIISIRKSK